MKYELLRNKVTLIALLGVLAGAELVFLFGAVKSKLSTLTLGIFFLMLASGAAYFTIWLQGLTGFRRDLMDKSGYMLFLTPVSPYRIVVAKLIVALGELVLTAGLVGVLAAVDLKILRGKYEKPIRIIETAAEFLGVDEGDLWAAFFVVILTSMMSVLCLYSMAYLFAALYASSGIQKNLGKGGGILFVVVVLFIYFFITLNLPTVSSTLKNPVVRGFVEKIPRHIFYVVGTLGCTWGTGYLLDRKISL